MSQIKKQVPKYGAACWYEFLKMVIGILMAGWVRLPILTWRQSLVGIPWLGEVPTRFRYVRNLIEQCGLSVYHYVNFF